MSSAPPPFPGMRAGADAGDERRMRILATVDSIPAGRISSYGRVADEAGLPRGHRQVARVLRELPEGTRIPWHRVVNAKGRVSTRGPARKAQLERLRAEGHRPDATGRIRRRGAMWP